MPKNMQAALATTISVTIFIACGCSSKPSRVDPPTIDASAAGIVAMGQYDKNADGKVGGNELESAPALRVALNNLDTNGDRAVSAEEVTARIKNWQKVGTGLAPAFCQVIFRGKPLVGATITFEPEAFLGDNIRECVGTTNQQGTANLSIPDLEDRLHGCAYGLYVIKITSSHTKIPEKYNTQSLLAIEIANDSATAERGVVLNLR